MEKIIKEYLKEYKLKVLDNKYRRLYTGVTLNYIVYDLLKAKYKKSDVAKHLLELHKSGGCRSLYCPNVDNYVIESPRSGHENFNTENGGGNNTYTRNRNLHTYLKQFIRHE